MDKKRANNVQYLTPFTSDRQPTPEAKSKGRLKAEEKKRIQKTAAELLIKKLAEKDHYSGLTNKEAIIDTLNESAKCGNLKAIELILRLIGELEDINKINIMSNVQKVFVTQKQEQQANKHIEDVING